MTDIAPRNAPVTFGSFHAGSVATIEETDFACPGRISYRSSATNRIENQRKLKWLVPDLATRVRYPAACMLPELTGSCGGPGAAIRTHQRLAGFICDNMEAILQAWEEFAGTIEPELSTISAIELRQHAQQMIVALSADLVGQRAEAVSAAKSSWAEEAGGSEHTTRDHAAACLHSGYSIVQLVGEYHALRRCILSLWTKASRRTLATDPADVMRFNEAIDQALSESVAQYQRLVDQSQNMFLAILGHDLRNPLFTLVAGAALMLNDTDLAPKHVMMATRMLNASRRMKKLIDDFIDFTRTHLGSCIPVKAKPCDLVGVCWQVVNELRMAYPKRFVDLRTPPKLDATFDPDRIAQVLSNLIGNALQYGNEVFPVRVFVSTWNETIEIAVNNRGSIIPPDRMERIFDAMVRFSSNTGVENFGRTSLGIGLYISREIIKAHGGQITVVSNAEQGTTFTITMPRKGLAP